MISKRGVARTHNRWLNRTLPKKRFSHPVYCHFYHSPLDTDYASTLDRLLMSHQHIVPLRKVNGIIQVPANQDIQVLGEAVPVYVTDHDDHKNDG